MFHKKSKLDVINTKLQKMAQKKKGIEREMMEKKNDLVFMKEKKERQQIEKKNKADQVKVQKLEIKGAKLEAKLKSQQKKQLVKDKNKSLEQLSSIETEMAQRKQLLKGYIEQMTDEKEKG